MNLLIGKSNFVAPFPLGKMCTQPIWSFPALFNSTDSKSFSLLNFQNLKRKNTWILISIAFTKKSEKWTVRFKAQRVQVIYRMHWHQMRWGSPHKDIDTPWPKPKQHRCQYQWDNVNMWTPPSMIYICCKKKDTCNLTMYRCFGISLDEQWPCTWFALKYNTIQKLVFGSELYLFKVARCLNIPRASNNLLSKYLSNPKWAFNANICKIIIYHFIIVIFGYTWLLYWPKR